MFDFHLHSRVSFDTDTPPEAMVQAAAERGLREICFTDHYDCHFNPTVPGNLFTAEQYRAAYGELAVPSGLKVRRGVEFGLTTWNTAELSPLQAACDFDFVIGSVHFADGYDPYDKEYWDGKTVEQAFRRYLETVLACVEVHRGFDVLGHLTYVCKSAHNPTGEPVNYADYRELTDEILKILVNKGIGIEINTSGLASTGDFLPGETYVRRFRELGGEIVTVGTDAHSPDRVGDGISSALELLKEVFGYVCTFEKRTPVFHTL